MTGEVRRVITLHNAFNHCRHGLELRDVSAHAAAQGWVVWGHYPCRICGMVALDYVTYCPQVALIGDRQLPILIE